MKIGIVQTSVGSVGGNDTVLRIVIDTLKADGHDVILYTFSNPGKNFDDVKTYSKIPIRLPFLGIYKKFMMPKFDYNCDVVFSITGYTGIETDKKLIVYDQNNLGLELLDSYIPPKYKSGIWKYYYKPYRFLAKRQRPNPNATYIANSIYSASSLSQAVNKKVDVIYPPVTISKYHKSEKKKKVAMLCRISPEKNLEFAIDALNKIRYPVTIIGAVTPMTMPYFNKLQDKCASHVIISPNISRQNLEHILSESKVFFHSAIETFGISVIEGIASGCIPIVPDNSAHPETVPYGQLRYVPDNIDDAVSHINDAIDGKFDDTLDNLYQHITKFDTSTFKDEISRVVKP